MFVLVAVCFLTDPLIILHLVSLQAKDGGLRTTIYKRDPSKQYGLKMKTSRVFLSEVERRFDAMPFTLRSDSSSTLDIREGFEVH